MANRKKSSKFNLYNLFNSSRSGKGLTKEEANAPRDFRNFFKFAWRNIGVLCGVNAIMVLGNFPLILALIGFSGLANVNTTAASSVLFAPVYGAMKFSSGPVTGALFGVHGVQTMMSIPTTASHVLCWLGLLVVLTFGVVSVGTSYILRNLVRGDPVFLWSDFAHAVKRNWKQALIFGAIDALLLGLTAFDVLFFFANAGTFFNNLLLGIMVILTVIFQMARYYGYIMMVTFDLSIFKLIKNSVIFALIGLKRNILAFLGTVALAIINWWLFTHIMALGVMLPFVITFGFGAFMGAYAAYPKIKEIMIDPYYTSDKPESEKIIEETEQIFTDRG